MNRTVDLLLNPSKNLTKINIIQSDKQHEKEKEFLHLITKRIKIKQQKRFLYVKKKIKKINQQPKEWLTQSTININHHLLMIMIIQQKL